MYNSNIFRDSFKNKIQYCSLIKILFNNILKKKKKKKNFFYSNCLFIFNLTTM